MLSFLLGVQPAVILPVCSAVCKVFAIQISRSAGRFSALLVLGIELLI
jgi:hypothetical protein